MTYDQPLQVIGFHSCERVVGLRILRGEDHLKPSDNPWDWLGPGIYFWEYNPYRALEYAIECARGNQKFSGMIKTPFVIGAIINLGKCLNLTEPNSVTLIRTAYKDMQATISEAGHQMPKNIGANRKLDCAVIKYVHEANRSGVVSAYDTIRCPFQEGDAVYEGANFTDRLHTEVCVLNPEAIKGYFLPQPITEFNPYLKGPGKISA